MKALFFSLSLLLSFGLTECMAGAKERADDSTCLAPSMASDPLFSTIDEVQAKVAEDASCDVVTLGQARKEFKAKFPDNRPQVIADVQGIQLKGSADEIAFARQVIVGGGHDSKSVPSSWPAVAKDCGTVVCGLSKLFGSEESALRILSIAKQSGYVLTALQFQNTSGVDHFWKPFEVRAIERVTAGVPADFQHMKAMKYFQRYPDGFRQEGHPEWAAWASHERQEIVILDSVFKDPEFAEPAIFHELSHHYDFQGLDSAPANAYFSTTSEFTKISGWNEGVLTPVLDKDGKPTGELEKVYTHAKDARFVRDYAATAPLEDFAESSAYYRYRPTDLMITSPEKYQLLKSKVFKGVEYTESGGWPAMSRELALLGGTSGLLRSCLAQLKRISPKGPNAEFWIATPGVPSSSTGAAPSWFATACMKDTTDQLISRLQSDPEFCMRGGAQFVSSVLERMLDGTMADISAAVWKGTQETTDADRACAQGKDLTHNCSVVSRLLANPSFLKLTPLDQKAISDQFENLMPLSQAMSAIVARDLPAQKVFLSCLTAVDALSIRGGEIIYTRKTPSLWYNTSDFSSDENCKTATNKIFTDAGYKTNSNAISAQLENQEFRKRFSTFKKEVLTVWANTSDLARRKLVNDWATRQGFDTNAVANILLPYLRAHIAQPTHHDG